MMGRGVGGLALDVLCIFMICLVIFNSGCKENTNETDTKNMITTPIEDDVQECKMICDSHNWAYLKDTYRGVFTSTCYCIDDAGNIWTFQI